MLYISIRIRFVVRSLLIRLVSFAIRFRSFDHSLDQSIRLCHFVYISSQTRLCSSITVHLSYTSLPGSPVRLPHDFVFYPVLIVLPVEVAIDTLIKTTPKGITREQSFREILCIVH